MKHILLTLFLIPMFFFPENKASFPPVTVLELFTSQGCSSCPPADELLSNIAKNDYSIAVIVLSYHVDYWNYLGWKDPFSKSSFSDKQRAYNLKFNSSSSYTPQLVVNGKEHFVGSNTTILDQKLKAYSKQSAENKVEIANNTKNEDQIYFDYNILGNINKKSLRVILIIEERITEIPRGENRNRTLKNSNIVINEAVIQLESSNGKSQINIPELVNENDKLKLVVLVQNTDLYVVGAAQVNL